ncbi:MAG: ECF-type sigma factor [Myxococcota bacterium]
MEPNRAHRDVPELFDELYEELHRVAHQQRRRWVGNPTLSTTALLHEGFLKIAAARSVDPNDLEHFHAIAARAMRQVLLDYAERARAKKRGGARVHLVVEATSVPVEPAQEPLVAVTRALDRLARIDARRAKVFEFRFFLGLSVAETAEVLGISAATVKRDWGLASAFLQLHLEEG